MSANPLSQSESAIRPKKKNVQKTFIPENATPVDSLR